MSEFENRFIDDIPAEVVREELGEPPYEFEENTNPYGRHRKDSAPYTFAVNIHCDELFTWRTWWKRLFWSSLAGLPFVTRGRLNLPFVMRERLINYPRYLPSSTILPILLRKTWRRFASMFKKGA